MFNVKSITLSAVFRVSPRRYSTPLPVVIMPVGSAHPPNGVRGRNAATKQPRHSAPTAIMTGGARRRFRQPRQHAGPVGAGELCCANQCRFGAERNCVREDLGSDGRGTGEVHALLSAPDDPFPTRCCGRAICKGGVAPRRRRIFDVPYGSDRSRNALLAQCDEGTGPRAFHGRRLSRFQVLRSACRPRRWRP
jgi:hypothetical protein